MECGPARCVEICAAWMFLRGCTLSELTAKLTVGCTSVARSLIATCLEHRGWRLIAKESW
jgi:hypothetical protein